MPLIPCRECGQHISTDAANCPRCGAAGPTSYDPVPREPASAVSSTPHPRARVDALTTVDSPGQKSNTGAWVIAGFVSLVFIGMCSAVSGSNGASSAGAVSLTDKSVVDAAAPASSLSPKDAYVAMIDRELASLKTFTGDEYRGSREAIQIEIVVFAVWAETLNKAKEHDLSAAEKGKVARFRRGVSAIQTREFPRMRAAWTKFVRETMREHDLDVQIGGETGRTLRLTSTIFASDSNIKKVQELLQEGTVLLRFRRIEYRWYEGADDYTSFTMEAPTDGALRRISGDGFKPAD